MKTTAALAAALALLAAPAFADEVKTFHLSIKDHHFTPETLEVPAGEKFKLVVKNEDKTAEEFESKSLKREKVIAASSEAIVNLGPLKAGEYAFVGEYHEDIAKGKIVAK